MSVYAVPTLPDAAETASTSAPICATPWMSRTTPLTVAAEAATIMPGASESVRAPSANPNRIQQRCTVRIPCASPAFSSNTGRNQLARQDDLRRHPVIANTPRNRFAVLTPHPSSVCFRRALFDYGASAHCSQTRDQFTVNFADSSVSCLVTPSFTLIFT
jgi:hypothetical protein